MLLDTYCTWGPDGEYFNADSPTLDGETRFAVLELLSLEDKPKLLSSILFSLIPAIQEKCTTARVTSRKSASLTRPRRLLGGSNPHAARFIETGYRTVRRHRGSFITITRGIKDFGASKEAEAARTTVRPKSRSCRTPEPSNNTSRTTRTSSPIWKRSYPGLPARHSDRLQLTLVSAGEFSSFHRLFVDPITRAMFSSRGEDFAFMQDAQRAGATAEEAAYMLAQKKFGPELLELEEWVKAA